MTINNHRITIEVNEIIETIEIIEIIELIEQIELIEIHIVLIGTEMRSSIIP